VGGVRIRSPIASPFFFFFFFFFTPPFPDEWLTDTRAREDVPMERFHLLLNQTLSSLLNLTTTLSTSSTSL
jgi:hypothetical protein